MLAAKLRSRRSRCDSLTLLFRRSPQPVLMLPHPVAVAPDVDDVAMVQQPVDERRRHDLVAEHVSPFFEAGRVNVRETTGFRVY